MIAAKLGMTASTTAFRNNLVIAEKLWSTPAFRNSLVIAAKLWMTASTPAFRNDLMIAVKVDSIPWSANKKLLPVALTF